jgi:hypothetical protein
MYRGLGDIATHTQYIIHDISGYLGEYGRRANIYATEPEKK